MVDGRQVHVPFELVGFDLRFGDAVGSPPATRCPRSGWVRAHRWHKASLHALLEVVENDATALIDVFGWLAGFTQPVEYRRGHHRASDAAMTRIASSGLDCFFVKRKPAAWGFPTIAAYITTPGEIHANSGTRAFAGFACRLAPEEAALAALLEAVQSRLTQIAGSRDDLTAQDYLPRHSIPSPGAGARRHVSTASLWPDVAAGRDGAEKLRHALAAVQRAGARDVVFVPLGWTAFPASALSVYWWRDCKPPPGMASCAPASTRSTRSWRGPVLQ